MFDIGFWELALISVIALLVVGPERLPGMARTVGLWVGRVRRYVSHVKDDIEREIRAEELREMMSESSRIESLDEDLAETRKTLESVRQDIEEADVSMNRDVDADADGATGSAADDAATAVGRTLSSGGGAGGEDGGNDDEGTPQDGGLEQDDRRSG